MSRELEFTGWWEGDVVFGCDNCGKEVRFRFDDEDEAKNIVGQRNALRNKRGWRFDKVDGNFVDACCERCRLEYIRNNTI